MRKKLAGLALASTLAVGAGPFVGTASANGDVGPTDPVLCFVAAVAVINQALEDFRGGHLSGAELRQVLLGTSSFLGECLTPPA